ncbi:MAG: hypothetical protein IKX34_00080 [Bacteroidales bacterium]|nr:hypothetical protein [Bacteroidales bacterium]
MKRIFAFMLVAAVAVLVFASCKETLPKRFDLFVNYVEKNCEKFSEDDWSKANARFEKLVDEYTQNRSSYNVDEQKQIRADIVKYVGLAAKSGIKTAIDSVNGLIDQIPSLLDGIGNFLKDLGLGGSESDEE